jgi:hypothetical protein
MSGIWSETERGWRPLSPVGFAQEQELHELIERNPGMLPLAGAPRLVILGREVRCGNGYADLIAVEADTGVPVVIEIKLASNVDRRMVLTQVLGYAAYLHRLDAAGFSALMAPYLAKKHTGTIVDAVGTSVEDPSFDGGAFTSGLEESRANGRLRCVIVIDQAPPDVVELVGYLQEVSNDRLSLDLVSVSAYQVGDRQVLVPQLVEPERTATAPPVVHRGAPAPIETAGAHVFAEAIEHAPAEHQELLRQLVDWAMGLEADGLAVLRTATGKGRWLLKPHLPGQQRGLVTLWNDGGGYVSPYRTVFEQEAPNTLARLDEKWPGQIGQGNYIDHSVLVEVLEVLRAAYQESAQSGVRAT